MSPNPKNSPDINPESSAPSSSQEWQVIENFSPERRERRKMAQKQAGRYFALLVIIGLVLGVFVSIGTVKLLKQWGLLDRPQPTLPKN